MTLHFPSEKFIISYLELHPLTGKKINRYLSEKKIINAVAKFFSHQYITPQEVDRGVMLTLHVLNTKLQLPQICLIKLQTHLAAALKDCAAGKSLIVEKKLTAKL